MADTHFRGDATAVAQVNTATPANVESTDIFALIINGKSVTFTASAATVANVTAGLTAAWNISTVPEFMEVTAVDSTTHVTLTADTPGKPFTVTATATDGGGTDTQTLAIAITTANDGPNVWSANNFSEGSLPGSGDDVWIADSDVDIKYMPAAAVDVDSVNIFASYTGEIGLPRTNTDGSTDYTEYRTRFLETDTSEVNIGEGAGDGSGRVMLNFGTTATLCTVYTTASAADDTAHAVQLKGGAALGALRVLDGTVDVAHVGGDTGTFPTITVTGSSTVALWDGVSVTTLNVEGNSTVELRTTCTTLTTRNSGSVTVTGVGAITTLDVLGGVVDHRGSGTVTTANVGSGGKLSFDDNIHSTITVANATMEKGSALWDNRTIVSFSSGIDLGNNQLSDVDLQLGRGRTITPD